MIPGLNCQTYKLTIYTTFYLTCIVRPSVGKIFAVLYENLPLGVVFCVDHESDIFFRSGTGIKANRAIEISQKFALFREVNSHNFLYIESSYARSSAYL